MARLTFIHDLRKRARIGRRHLRPFLLKHLFSDRRKLGNSPLGIVHMELSGQMQLVIDDRVKFNMTCRTDDISVLRRIDLTRL